MRHIIIMLPTPRPGSASVLYAAGLVVFFVSASARAQVVPPPFPTEPPLLEEKARPIPPPRSVLPPLPSPPSEKPAPLPHLRVFIREVRITGGTILTRDEVDKIVAPYLNREVTSEDLEMLRLALTLSYVNKGYVTSGAIIPDQTVAGGVLTFQIIEGALTGIEVEGNEWFRASYLQDRIALGAGRPVNINAMQERLQLLQQDERLQRLNAELKPGIKPGESTLKVRVAETSPYKIGLEFNNYQSPSVGATRGLGTVAHQNLTGNGDILSAKYGYSKGVNPQFEARYVLPVTARDTTVMLQYRKNDFRVVDPAFEALHIVSESQIYGVTLRHPVYRTLNQEFALALTAEHLRSKLFVGGAPDRFFSIGARNGETIVSALRFSQEWLHRSPNQVIAAFSRLSFGIDVLDAVNDGDPGVLRESTDQKFPDGEFVAWLGQFQYARRLDPWGIQVIGRVDCQLANDRLFSLEQISVGGRYSVRGYRENEFVRDNGLIGSLEVRVPAVRAPGGGDILQVVPFVDFGRSWSRKTANAHGDSITSAGLGFIWNVILYNSRLEAYWGKRLNSVPTPNRGLDMQDFGFHIQLTVTAM